MLVQPVQGKLLILYLTVHEKLIGCVLGQHDETGRKEQAIYYLSKKFTDYESRYSPLEKMCCALAWVAQRFRQYMLYHTTWLIAKLDPIKFILRNLHCLEESQGGKSCYRSSISYMYLKKPSKEAR